MQQARCKPNIGHEMVGYKFYACEEAYITEHQLVLVKSCSQTITHPPPALMPGWRGLVLYNVVGNGDLIDCW